MLLIKLHHNQNDTSLASRHGDGRISCLNKYKKRDTLEHLPLPQVMSAEISFSLCMT